MAGKLGRGGRGPADGPHNSQPFGWELRFYLTIMRMSAEAKYHRGITNNLRKHVEAYFDDKPWAWRSEHDIKMMSEAQQDEMIKDIFEWASARERDRRAYARIAKEQR